MSWSMVYTAQALADKQRFAELGLSHELTQALSALALKPTDGIALVGDLTGAWSKTIIAQHCIVYQVIAEKNTVKIVGII